MEEIRINKDIVFYFHPNESDPSMGVLELEVKDEIQEVYTKQTKESALAIVEDYKKQII